MGLALANILVDTFVAAPTSWWLQVLEFLLLLATDIRSLACWLVTVGVGSVHSICFSVYYPCDLHVLWVTEIVFVCGRIWEVLQLSWFYDFLSSWFPALFLLHGSF